MKNTTKSIGGTAVAVAVAAAALAGCGGSSDSNDAGKSSGGFIPGQSSNRADTPAENLPTYSAFAQEDASDGTDPVPVVLSPGGVHVELPAQIMSSAPVAKKLAISSFDVMPRSLTALDRCAADIRVNFVSVAARKKTLAPVPMKDVKGNEKAWYRDYFGTAAKRSVHRPLGLPSSDPAVHATSSKPSDATLESVSAKQFPATFTPKNSNVLTVVGNCNAHLDKDSEFARLRFIYTDPQGMGGLDLSFATVKFALTSIGSVAITKTAIDGYKPDGAGSFVADAD